jgi:2-haloacid dehalogenase
MVETQLANTDLDDYFTHILSVASARCYKPHPKAYALAANALGCAHADLRLIATHDWDITGAMRTGYAGAFVARHGEVVNALGEMPDIIGSDLADVADQLIAKEE